MANELFDFSPRYRAVIDNIDVIGPWLAAAGVGLIIAVWWIWARIIDLQNRGGQDAQVARLVQIRRALLPPMLGCMLAGFIAALSRVWLSVRP